MPSTQRRVSNFPAVGGRNVVTANLFAGAYSLVPGCRSESLVVGSRSSGYGNLISPPPPQPQQLISSTDSMDNWFPANAFDVRMASSSCQGANSSSPGSVQLGSFQQQGLEGLGDFQEDAAWWPSLARDRRSSPQRVALMSDAKSAASTFQAMESSWRHNPTATVDLNAPSAIAVVSVAPGGGVETLEGEEEEELLTTTAVSAGRKVAGRKTIKSMSAPTSPSELRAAAGKSSLGVQKWNGKRPVSQRENHIWSERQRRKGMNYLFSTLRSLLPHPTSKTDKSTVVGEIIKYIQSLQVNLEELTKKQQQVLAARTLSAFHHSLQQQQQSVADVTALPKAFVSNGLTLVDHSGDPACVTAITALPPPGRESCLASYLGSNVGLHVCGLNVFITTSSPRGRHGLLQQLLLTIHKHDLDVINANISTSNASIFHCLHCQASQDAEFLNNALHSALQSVINNFA